MGLDFGRLREGKLPYLTGEYEYQGLMHLDHLFWKVLNPERQPHHFG